jgi:radical S-adenosyl methionine domain-containing protein 2
MIQLSTVKSVNWHITSKCNYHCQFCYTKDLGMDSAEPSLVYRLLTTLRDFGIEKINFVGGEPLLHPNIYDFCYTAKDLGFTVCLTTNGSLLNIRNIPPLSEYVDWIGISVDSPSDKTEKILGRGNGNHVSHALEISEICHEYGLSLKINTTVTKLNFQDHLEDLIARMNPHRWKIFQVLRIVGQNDESMERLGISDDEFQIFMKTHEQIRLTNGSAPVFEKNDDMLNSYFMISPLGNIISNLNGKYTHLPLTNLLEWNLATIVDPVKYQRRGAVYSWK